MRAVANPQDGSVAKLYDSAGNDSFVSGVSWAGVNYAVLEGTGFSNRVESFAKVYAYSTAGGVDVAKMFDSTGNDTFYATPVQAYMTGKYGATSSTEYYHEVNNFAGVHAYSTQGGTDLATLHDSAGNEIGRASWRGRV